MTGHVHHLVVQLAVASAMALVTVFIHLIGLALLVRVLRLSHRVEWRRSTPLTILLVGTLGVFATHTVEIWLYAALYIILNSAFDLETALYFSTVTYASVGYGDVLLPNEWRIVGAIEGATGIIMLGWSTAFLVSLLAQLKLFSHDWLSLTRAR